MENLFKKFRKKPIVIEAFQYTQEIADLFAGKNHEQEERVITFLNDCAKILTLEGEMKADINDWIIKGVQGELYPCKPEIFEQTYEEE